MRWSAEWISLYVTGADQCGAVSFFDIDNRYILAGAQYNPQVLAGLTAAQIAGQLSNHQARWHADLERATTADLATMLTGGDAVVYLTLKGEADDYLRSRDLDWTVLRPAMLTDDPGTGRIRVGTGLPLGSIPGPTSSRCWRGSSPTPTACGASSRSPAAKKT